MHTQHSKFNAKDLFDSLPPDERKQIMGVMRQYTLKREQGRYSRLEEVEIAKQALVQGLEKIEYEIAENNEWFIAAQKKEVEITAEAINLHRKIADKLYSRKKLIDHSLLEAELSVKTIITQIESEDRQESVFQQRNLEQLLEPIYEKLEIEREHEYSRMMVLQFKNRQKQRVEEDCRRQKEYEAFLDHQRTEELERKQNLEAKRLEEIRARVHARQIPYLVHFTPLSNLASILKNGLQSRNALAGYNFIFTDERRSDGWLDWISISVKFPNYKMFYTKRNTLKDVDGWVVLLIRIEALWELECKFILTNAASFGIRMFGDERWSSVKAFEDMFGHVEHRVDIPEYYTTDPQAEVMVRNEIPSCYISMIAVQNTCDISRLNNLSDIQIEVRPELFRWRSDYEHWSHHVRLNPFPNNNNLITLSNLF